MIKPDRAGPHLTTLMLARRLHVTTKTLERWRESGFGPRFLKLGKRVLYPEAVVAEWELSRVVQSNAEADRVLAAA